MYARVLARSGLRFSLHTVEVLTSWTSELAVDMRSKRKTIKEFARSSESKKRLRLNVGRRLQKNRSTLGLPLQHCFAFISQGEA